MPVSCLHSSKECVPLCFEVEASLIHHILSSIPAFPWKRSYISTPFLPFYMDLVQYRTFTRIVFILHLFFSFSFFLFILFSCLFFPPSTCFSIPSFFSFLFFFLFQFLRIFSTFFFWLFLIYFETFMRQSASLLMQAK
jgi:hypothetical protein